MKVLYVEWVDAVAESGWEKREKIKGVDQCISLGFLVKEDDNSITLAAAISEDQSNARITIPKKWITKKKVVKLEQKRGR